MSLTVKAYLEKDGKWDAEIRRFQIPADVSSSYAYLNKKLCDIFPSLREGKFSTFWKDNDGDVVSFSADEELMEALGFVSDSILKIFVQQNEGQSKDHGASDDEQVHPGVICDGCEGRIMGPRFKCLVCPDYDLCRSCEGKGLHVEHDMMKINHPGNAGPFSGFPGFPGCHFGPGGPGGPMGPQGPQGPHGPHGPFQPPPHFRRWMQKFMRRWHTRNAPGWEGAEKEETTEEDQPQGQEEQAEGTEEDFLKTVGESVAAMLDPFGIDVDIDVETQEKTGGKMRGKCGGRGGRGGRGRCGNGGRGRCGPPGAHGNPWNVWGCGRMGGHPSCRQGGKHMNQEEREKCRKEKEQEASTSNGETMETEVPKTTEQPPQAQEVPSAPKTPSTMDIQTDGPPRDPKQGDSESGWTLLNTLTNTQGEQMDAQVIAGPTAPAPAPTGVSAQPPVRPPQLYPMANVKVAEALEQMLAMGFNNDGGWLTNLLETKDGDIVQVLDALKPNPARSGDGGNLA